MIEKNELKKKISTAIFEDNGFVTLKLLTKEQIDSLLELLTDFISRKVEKEDYNLSSHLKNYGLGLYHDFVGEFKHSLFWTKSNRELNEIFSNWLIENDIFSILKDEYKTTLEIKDLIFRLIRPGEEADISPIHADGWFRDAGLVESYSTKTIIRTWIPLIAEPNLNGLYVLPKSHRKEWRVKHVQKENIKKPVLDEEILNYDSVLLPLSPGEAVFFSDRLLHGGALNKGKFTRVSIEASLLF